jgi:cytochrome P450
MISDDVKTSISPAPHQKCPVDHSKLSGQKIPRRSHDQEQTIMRGSDGTYHIYGFAEARAILRMEGTKQRGFGAERFEKLPKSMRDPILYMEGEAHQAQRTKTARFFTPKTTDEQYRGFMERFSDEILEEFKRDKRADLSDLSMKLAVQVAAQVVGLTDSSRPGMAKRIEKFFEQPSDNAPLFKRVIGFLRNQLNVYQFFNLDVKPAIEARKKNPKEDVISHTLKEGYTPIEILTECVTYGAAGMVTTREFICFAAWHLLEHEELKKQYLDADEKTRYKILHELLRLEPVVERLHRKALRDLEVPTSEGSITIPEGSDIVLYIDFSNTDTSVVGEASLSACPVRELPRGIPDAVMSFGDGHHRCPGAYVAIQETDIFLQRLLRLNPVLEHAPSTTWKDLVSGHEVRQFMIRLP